MHSYLTNEYKETIAGSEIYRSINKSKKKTRYKKLIIGDSTANQFFNNREDNDSIYYLACNQAIGVCGHFFLLNNYIKAGNLPEEVYMVYNPLSFANNLDQTFTYHYFLKPFYNNEYKPLMTCTVYNQIKKIPYYYLCQAPFILTSSWRPQYKPEERDYTFVSPISCEYLRKIDSLCYEYKFKLYLIPSLVDKNKQKEIESFERDEFEKEKYAQKLTIYLDNIIYLNDSCFSDGTHLKPSLIKQYKPLLEREMTDIKKIYTDHNI